MRLKAPILLALFFAFVFPTVSKAQAPSLPLESQRSVITQRIGITDITITYYSPAVKGRKIWGDLVPYGQVWRAGANWNTVIAFTHDVTIQGKTLPAGSYGLHTIPTEKEWTIIFSKRNNAWGSFTYKESEDALRITASPETIPFQEWLSYDFIGKSAKQATVALSWEKLRIPFRIDVDVDKMVLGSFRQRLATQEGDTNWQVSYSAAQYCLTNSINLDEAMTWADKSIKVKPSFTNYMLKAGILAKTGKVAESAAMEKKAMTLATKDELNQHGYILISEKKYKEAVEIFKLNLKNNPDDWNMYDSLAEGYSNLGEKKKAAEYYNKALAKAPEDQRERIKSVLSGIGSN